MCLQMEKRETFADQNFLTTDDPSLHACNKTAIYKKNNYRLNVCTVLLPWLGYSVGYNTERHMGLIKVTENV